MKIGGTYQQSIKQLGRQHIAFIEQELQNRGIGIKQSHVRHTMQFTGGWEVVYQGIDFKLKLSSTGTALTYRAPGINEWKSTTFRDFDQMLAAMQQELPIIRATTTHQQS